jgi:predicted DNA repair protein MutK
MLDQTTVKALCAGFVGATIAVVLDHVSVLGMSMMLWIAGVMIVLALLRL